MSTVARNIVWSGMATMLQIYTGGIVFILMARLMDIEGFGLLSFGFSLATLLSTCLDFGQSLMVIKDLPQNAFNNSKYILNTLAQKSLLVLVFVPLTLLYLWLFYSGEWIEVGFRFAGFAIVSALVMYLQAILRARNRFKNYAYSAGVYAILVTALVLMFALEHLTLIQFINGMVVTKTIQCIGLFIDCRHIFHRRWFSPEIQKYLLKYSWSFGVHFIFGTFYFMIDTQVIALFLEAEDVALYQSVFRLIYICLMLSDIASSVMLPFLSSRIAKDQALEHTSQDILYFLTILGCVLFLFLTVFSKEIMAIIYPDAYSNAIQLVIPLSLVVLIRTSASIFGNLLTISNNQINRVKVVFVSMLASMLLNFSLIPVVGIAAAAWVSVLVHLILLLGYYYFVRREFDRIKLVNRKSGVIILVTILCFFVSEYLFRDNLIFRLITFITWILGIIYIIRSHKMDKTLRALMDEKGVV